MLHNLAFKGLNMKLKGSCHSQAVSFTLDSETPYPFIYCYCSICRKTTGGGGYAINIMGLSDTLKVKGMKHVKIYRAQLKESGKKRATLSSGRRHFCSNARVRYGFLTLIGHNGFTLLLLLLTHH